MLQEIPRYQVFKAISSYLSDLLEIQKVNEPYQFSIYHLINKKEKKKKNTSVKLFMNGIHSQHYCQHYQLESKISPHHSHSPA